jgi:hypothetical protein
MDTTTSHSEADIFTPNYGVFIGYMLLAPFFGFMLYILLTVVFLQDHIVSGVIGSIATLVMLGFIYGTRDIIYVTQEGIRLKSKLNEHMILWEDVIAISSITDWNGSFCYTIKTIKGTIYLPIPIEYERFEKLFETYGSMEIEAKATTAIKLGPFPTRWKKIGKPYEYTNTSDMLANVSFTKNKYIRYTATSIFVLLLLLYLYLRLT